VKGYSYFCAQWSEKHKTRKTWNCKRDFHSNEYGRYRWKMGKERNVRGINVTVENTWHKGWLFSDLLRLRASYLHEQAQTSESEREIDSDVPHCTLGLRSSLTFHGNIGGQTWACGSTLKIVWDLKRQNRLPAIIPQSDVHNAKLGVITPCSALDGRRRFGEIHCLHLDGRIS
jgi:hypothetical protein